LYPHIRVSATAPVCEAFAREGWCEKLPGTCEELHVWECGEWRAKGVCSRGGKCGLRHVIRAEKGRGSMDEAKVEGLGSDQKGTVEGLPVEGGFEGQDEFITFDQGSPEGISSDEEGSEEDSDEDDEGGKGKLTSIPTRRDVIDEDEILDTTASDDDDLDVLL
jgi:hypothetical protein